MEPRHFTIPVFVPQLACPFECIFCSQRRITGQDEVTRPEEVPGIVDQYLATFPKSNKVVEIGFFGGNFTGIPFREQERYLAEARVFLDRGLVKGIRLSTRPDYINESILEMLKHFGVTTIELGAQSMDDGVLLLSARGHSASDTIVASRMIRDYGFRLGLQMMIGLPGDNPEKSLDTARQIVSLGAAEARIYPVIVVRGTKLEKWTRDATYKPLSLEDAIEWTAPVLDLLESEGIIVTRVGLHPSGNLLSGKELVAGPFHPSFRELVESRLWQELLETLLPVKKEEDSAAKGKQPTLSFGPLKVHIAPGQRNAAIGHQAANRKMLEKYFIPVRFITDTSLSGRQFYADRH
jgi:histone acetyltransferase (RNA polymerase elongator complex component)